MNDREFLRHIRSRVARAAIGAPAARGHGNAGVVAVARNFLRQLRLHGLGTSSKGTFQRRLDCTTEDLRRRLPVKARHWGLARKVLNIFLRDALYTSYLRDAYNLNKAEAFFEIPLDSITAKRLAQEIGRRSLPRWHGVKHLTPEMNAQYQAAAAQVADARGVALVHLDAIFWSSERDKRASKKTRHR